MADLRKAAEMALEALENPWEAGPEGVADAIIALRQALAQPKRGWVGLTDDEVTDCYLDSSENGILIEAAIEAKLKEKNT